MEFKTFNHRFGMSIDIFYTQAAGRLKRGGVALPLELLSCIAGLWGVLRENWMMWWWGIFGGFPAAILYQLGQNIFIVLTVNTILSILA